MLSLMSQDVVLASQFETGFNSSLINSTSDFNSSNENTTASKTGFLSMFVRMFTFRIPAAFGSTINIIINFLNFILLGIAIMCIYRIANPLA